MLTRNVTLPRSPSPPPRPRLLQDRKRPHVKEKAVFGYGEVRGPTLGGWDLGQGQRNLSPGTSRMEELQPPDGASGSAKPEGSSPTPAGPQSCWGLQALGLHSPALPWLPAPSVPAAAPPRRGSRGRGTGCVLGKGSLLPPTPAIPAPSSGASATPSRGQLTAPAAPVSQAVTLGGVCLRSRQRPVWEQHSPAAEVGRSCQARASR